jgi:uncharacterized protein YllA (UPF0747 family)
MSFLVRAAAACNRFTPYVVKRQLCNEDVVRKLGDILKEEDQKLGINYWTPMEERCKVYNREFPLEDPLDPNASLEEQIESLKKLMKRVYPE